MKFNPECLRDILLTVENCPGDYLYYWTESPVCEDTNDPPLDKYPCVEVEFHINLAEKSGYLESTKTYISNDIKIGQLTPEGYAFLDSIRSDTLWNRLKPIILSAVPGSIPALIDLLSKHIH